jgi:CubicO group peptidase (beta-lactamase class C family)
MEALALASTWPVVRHAVGAVTVEASVGSTRHLAHRQQEGDPGAFPWASVSKLASALAVLVALEEGTVSLTDPAGPPGSTVAHLLSHASGLGPGDTDAVVAAPGERRIYSNRGFEVLADLVTARAGLPFSTYLHEAVFDPLAMVGATLPVDGSAAHGVSGTLSDLLTLGTQWLAPSLVAEETVGRATQVAFPGLAGVLPGFGYQDPCDWGLGVEIKDGKRPHWTGAANSPGTFGHFGQSGGFLWLDPAVKVACAALTDRPFGRWAATAWPPFADAVLAESLA